MEHKAFKHTKEEWITWVKSQTEADIAYLLLAIEELDEADYPYRRWVPDNAPLEVYYDDALGWPRILGISGDII